jgi:hypothetical protein
VADSPSTEHRRRPLTAAERVTGAGGIAAAASMLLPWYEIPFSRGLSVTGLDNFGFAHAALLLTIGAAAFLVVREAGGHALPRPLRAGDLVAVAGAWAVVLTVYLIADRPEQLAGSTQVHLRYGIYVCLAGCLAVAVGGLRMRKELRARRP